MIGSGWVAPGFHGWVKDDEVVPLAQALAYFDSEVASHPDDAGNFLRRAHLRELKGESDKARTDFDEAIRLAPGYPVCFHDRAAFWFRKKEFDRALADGNEAPPARPDLRQRLRPPGPNPPGPKGLRQGSRRR